MAKNVQIDVKINTKDGTKNIGDLNKEVNKSITTINSLQDELNDLNRVLEDTEIGSEAFETMSKRSSELKTELAEVNAELDVLDPGAFASEIGSMASGLAATATAAYALSDAFGLTNDSTEEFIKKIGTGMAVAQAFSGGLQGVVSMQKLLRSSTLASTLATKGGTIATRIFNAVVKANPIGLLVTALLAAVTAFALFNSSSKDAEKNTKAIDEAQARLNKSMEQYNRLIEKRNVLEDKNTILKSNEAAIKTETKLIKLKQDLLVLRRDENASIEDLENIQKQIGAQELILINQRDAAAKQNRENAVEELRGRFKRGKDRIAKHKEDMESLYGIDKINAETTLAAMLEVQENQRQEIVNLGIEQRNELAALDNKLTDQKIKNSNDLYNIRNGNKEKEVKDEVEKNELAIAQLNLLKAEEILADVKHRKALALINAESIEDETERQNAIANVKQHYLDEETKALEDARDRNIDLLLEEYIEKSKSAKGDKEEQYRIQEEYANKEIELRRATELEIQGLSNETTVVQEEKLNELLMRAQEVTSSMAQIIESSLNGSVEDISMAFDGLNTLLFDEDEGLFKKIEEGSITAMEAISMGVQLAMGAVQSVFDNMAAESADKREQEYEADSESLKSQLENRSISQEQFDNKMKSLEQQKEQEELQAKRKAFRQSKALAITNAVMGTAQAVLSAFSSAAAIPIAGVALAPIMAGVAAAMGAAQIGIISSQTFKAARGGVVPGSGPKHIDSVDALLAPGETVINSQSSSMFPGLLSEINMAGGGVSLAPDVPMSSNGSSSSQPVFEGNRADRQVLVVSDVSKLQNDMNRIEQSVTFKND